MKRRWAGFTLIELMIVVAIVGILAAVAYPSYMDSVRKGRRAEAMTALSAIALEQEKWRANNSSYGDLAACTTPAAGCWKIATTADGTLTTEGGYYTLTMQSKSATGFTARAAAVSTKSQNNDTGCTQLEMNEKGPVTSTATLKGCWRRN